MSTASDDLFQLMTPRRAAVLGSPIAHSLSPLLHNAGYAAAGIESQWSYGRVEHTGEGLSGFLEGLGQEVRGLSVTMPAKFAALECADHVSDVARTVGAANTLVRDGSGWFATNTDVAGVRGAIEELWSGAERDAKGAAVQELRGSRVVVVGGGGTVRPVLFSLGIDFRVGEVDVINRSDKSADLRDVVEAAGLNMRFHTFDQLCLSGAEPSQGQQGLAELVKGAALVVSTVPSAALKGLEQDLAQAPVFDVIYDPWPTPLVLGARAAGWPAVGGHAMLAHQAFEQFELFTGVDAPRAAMRAALDHHLGTAG